MSYPMEILLASNTCQKTRGREQRAAPAAQPIPHAPKYSGTDESGEEDLASKALVVVKNLLKRLDRLLRQRLPDLDELDQSRILVVVVDDLGLPL